MTDKMQINTNTSTPPRKKRKKNPTSNTFNTDKNNINSPPLRNLTIEEEHELFHKIPHKSQDPNICRLRRKLLLRKYKRKLNLKLFNIEQHIQTWITSSQNCYSQLPPLPKSQQQTPITLSPLSFKNGKVKLEKISSPKTPQKNTNSKSNPSTPMSPTTPTKQQQQTPPTRPQTYFISQQPALVYTTPTGTYFAQPASPRSPGFVSSPLMNSHGYQYYATASYLSKPAGSTAVNTAAVSVGGGNVGAYTLAYNPATGQYYYMPTTVHPAYGTKYVGYPTMYSPHRGLIYSPGSPQVMHQYGTHSSMTMLAQQQQQQQHQMMLKQQQKQKKKAIKQTAKKGQKQPIQGQQQQSPSQQSAGQQQNQQSPVAKSTTSTPPTTPKKYVQVSIAIQNPLYAHYNRMTHIQSPTTLQSPNRVLHFVDPSKFKKEIPTNPQVNTMNVTSLNSNCSPRQEIQKTNINTTHSLKAPILVLAKVEDPRKLKAAKRLKQFMEQERPTFRSLILGKTDEEYYIEQISPYTLKKLKPFIRRDYISLPLKKKLIKDLMSFHYGTNSTDYYHLGSIDYCYLQRWHLHQVNSLLSQFFWPNIDMSEHLLYPDNSVVVLYKRLVIGCGFITPQGYISYILAHPEWKGAGITTFILYNLIMSIPSTRDVTIHVPASSALVIILQKFGFKQEAVIENFYDKFYPKDRQESRTALFMRLRRSSIHKVRTALKL